MAMGVVSAAALVPGECWLISRRARPPRIGKNAYSMINVDNGLSIAGWKGLRERKGNGQAVTKAPIVGAGKRGRRSAAAVKEAPAMARRFEEANRGCVDR